MKFNLNKQKQKRNGKRKRDNPNIEIHIERISLNLYNIHSDIQTYIIYLNKVEAGK